MPEIQVVAINTGTLRVFGPFDSYSAAHEWISQMNLACARTAGYRGQLPKFVIRALTSAESASVHDIF